MNNIKQFELITVEKMKNLILSKKHDFLEFILHLMKLEIYFYLTFSSNE